MANGSRNPGEDTKGSWEDGMDVKGQQLPFSSLLESYSATVWRAQCSVTPPMTTLYISHRPRCSP